MNYARLFIWVEGLDDVRFFERIIRPLFADKYNWIEIRQYAKLKNEKINNFLKSIRSMNADCILAADFNNSPCISSKKQSIIKKLNRLDINQIFIVVKEIESWYLAGMEKTNNVLGDGRNLDSTDEVTKEKFNKLIPKRFDSRIDFMIEVLNNYSVEIAKKKNYSFQYFYNKYFNKNQANEHK